MSSEQSQPMTSAQRQAALRARRLRAGMDQVCIWASANTLAQFAAYQKQHNLSAGDALAQLLNHQERK